MLLRLRIMSDKEFCSMKYKQYICENSTELREFERKLQTAYNRKVLEAQLAQQKVQQLRKQIIEKEIASIEAETRLREEKRLIEEEERKRVQEKHAALIIQNQIEAKKKSNEEELARQMQERLVLDEELKQERHKISSMAAERQRKKARLLQDQMEVLAQLRKRKEEKMRENAEEDARVRGEASQQTKYDEIISRERRQRIQHFELIKETLARQLSELQKLAQEKEEIRMRLACIEKEELDRQKSEQEQLAIIHRKLHSRQSYDDISQNRRLQTVRMKQEDIEYANRIKELLKTEEEREKQKEKEQRRVRTAVRTDNCMLAKYRTDRRATELEEERANAMLEMAERDARDKIVREERIQLLKSVHADLLEFLPPGTLSEEDILCLNCP